MVNAESLLNTDLIEISEHHTDIYQDENIRKSVYKEIQQVTWDFNEKSKNKKGA